MEKVLDQALWTLRRATREIHPGKAGTPSFLRCLPSPACAHGPANRLAGTPIFVRRGR